MTTPQSVRHLISAMRYDDARIRLTQYPNEAFTTSTPHLETALSTACRVKSPPSLISALLEANPKAALLKNRTGKTPLHILCSDLRKCSMGKGFDDDVEIVRSILQKEPTAAALVDEDGWLPLHYACASSTAVSSNLLTELLKVYPMSVCVCNKGGVTPLALLWDRCAINDESGLCVLSVAAAKFHNRVADIERIRSNQNSKSHGVRMPLNNSAAVWANVLLMAKAYSHGTTLDDDDEDEKFRALHALCGLADITPSMMEFALRVHTPLLETKDKNGNLPLHILCASSCPSSSSPKGQVVEMLLDAHPRAARTANNEGRIPLNLLIETGVNHWEEGGVRTLFQSAPEALLARDVKSRLYPFMMAGVVGSVDVTYHLLLNCPALVNTSGLTTL